MTQPMQTPITDPRDVAAVKMTDIKKSYGGVHALKGVSLTIRPGTIHALIGENGAGKSTLLKILQGVVIPTEGSIEVFGEHLTAVSPENSRRLGIGMIFQDLSLIPTLTIAQNIFLNREPRRMSLLVDERREIEDAAKIIGELNLNVDPRTRVLELSPGQAQLTEIAKAISQKARVLILDEPTSALSAQEVDILFKMLRKLTADGTAIIYVSHRMTEIMTIADEITILRDGQNVTSGNIADFTLDTIVQNMVGKRVTGFEYKPHEIDRGTQPALKVRSLSGKHGKPSDVSFDLYRGEVLGIAGLMGAGRTELARVLFGVDAKADGTVELDGKVLEFRSPAEAIEAGIVLVPESRHDQGLVIEHTVGHNLSLPQLAQLASGPFLDRRREHDLSSELISRLRIKTPDADNKVRNLSGGNQQKIVIAKWLATDPSVVILDEPTAGVDIGSKAEIVELIRSIASGGKSVIVISSEPAELLATSDRILVLSNGRLAREISRSEIDAWATTEGDESQSSMIRVELGLQVAIQKASQNVQ
ncbi:putative ribose ABC transporter ATP-binding protein [Sinorhizobium fredii NGR234]|uniref:Ribose ABC transporter ATP-binding protein n=1 Tax=Sinorhizobium fredii (strain NBRC 101917 / NGR234) TaxID=394 RepID=C3MI65_SINFN|nr:sugar ABC transporter ATP-binding protein [Sinorhizobium fredii]ACP24413.1 putative ribose ABC transporter ATP-binding protein [Sinorhizobium fredii NGR234]